MADDAAQLLRVDASQYRRIGSDDRADRFEAIAGYIEQLEATAADATITKVTEFLAIVRENNVAGLGPMKGWDSPFELIAAVRRATADTDLILAKDDGSPTCLLIAAARLIRAAELIEAGRTS